MKKLNLKNNIYLVARKSDNTKGKLDYYLRMQDGTERYALPENFQTHVTRIANQECRLIRLYMVRKKMWHLCHWLSI